MSLRIHAIVLALNEKEFISNQLTTLYPFCTGISILTQYDRDWYGKAVTPDGTIQIVANYPDPAGKIHLVVRRWPDEAGARNSEILALSTRSDRGVMSHGSDPERIKEFHSVPDYFLIVDADEFYDQDSFPRILRYLEHKQPRGMRVHGFNYVGTWNRRVPLNVVDFCQFGFLRPGVTFEMRRTVTWNESRLAKLLRSMRLPDFSSYLWGFTECPTEIGVFHHACWVGTRERLVNKASKSSHTENNAATYVESIEQYQTEFVGTTELPRSLRELVWPREFFEQGADGR